MKRLTLLLLLFSISPARLGIGAVEVTATRAALSTADYRATAAGLAALRNGGTAADAAVAVSFALSVVHPQAGNIGGGGFLLYYEKATGALWALDFREVAPAAATANMFVNADGSVKPDSVTGALASGVPGTVAGMAAAHAKFGKLSWKTLLEPSIALASEGFATPAHMARTLVEEEDVRKIARFQKTGAVFYPDGKALPLGARLVQKELAETLKRIAQRGASEFYQGQTARKMVASLKREGGIITLRDLREYKVVWRAPVAIEFGPYRIYTMPPPSGGAVVLGEALGVLQSFDLATAGFQSARSVHLISEASRRAYIDRNQFIGDPAFVQVPFSDFFSEKKLEGMAKTIDPEKATPTTLLTQKGGAPEAEHTTHFSIVDSEGNIAAVTTTLNGFYGSGLVVDGGFLMNNTMDDFTAQPGKPNLFGLVQSSANQIRPGARPSSSMTPSIIMRNEKPHLVFGSPGGGTIPTTLLQVFLSVAVYGKSLAEAIEAPRYHHQDFPDELQFEQSRGDRKLIEQLKAMGHTTKERSDIGDVHAVMINGSRLTAVADSRRGGSPGGF